MSVVPLCKYNYNRSFLDCTASHRDRCATINSIACPVPQTYLVIVIGEWNQASETSPKVVIFNISNL